MILSCGTRPPHNRYSWLHGYSHEHFNAAVTFLWRLQFALGVNHRSRRPMLDIAYDVCHHTVTHGIVARELARHLYPSGWSHGTLRRGFCCTPRHAAKAGQHAQEECLKLKRGVVTDYLFAANTFRNISWMRAGRHGRQLLCRYHTLKQAHISAHVCRKLKAPAFLLSSPSQCSNVGRLFILLS